MLVQKEDEYSNFINSINPNQYIMNIKQTLQDEIQESKRWIGNS
jgi:hypothetical protein